MVADAGGIAAAAPGDPMRQSQLSRQIAQIEDVYGLALNERRGRGIVLTAAGKALAVATRNMFATLRDVETYGNHARALIAVGTGNSVAHWWAGPRANAFSGARVRFVMLSGPEIVAGLVDSQLDFGIVRTSDLRRGLRSRPLGTIDYALYVPNALLPKSKPVDLKQLLATVPVGVLTGEPSFSEQLDDALRHAGLEIEPAYECETIPELRVLVTAGHCAAVLPTLARYELSPARVTELHDPILGKHEGRMNLVWTSRLERQRPRVAALVPGIVRGLQL
jgi:DNA-binding transcriptional LysR family regulator